MTLSCTHPNSTNNFGPGIFISRVTILKAEDVSGQELPFLQNPYEVGLKLTLEVGQDFHPEMTIGGQFKRDPSTGEVIGWGSGFVVQDALSRLGYKGPLDEGNILPQAVLEGLVGKEFIRLSYVSGIRDGGKAKYSDWNMIASVDDGAHSLVRRFKRSVSRGYPRNFHPDVLEPAPVENDLTTTGEDEPF